MRAWRKLFILSLLMSIVFMSVTPTQAQDEICPLGEVDCQFWAEMATAMRAVDTIQIEAAELDFVLMTSATDPTTFAFQAAGILGDGADIHFNDLNLDGQIYDEADLRQVDNMAYLYLPDTESWQGARLDQEGISFIDLVDIFSPSSILWLINQYGADPIGEWSRGADIESDEQILAVYDFRFRLNELLVSEKFTTGLAPFLTGFGGQDIDGETVQLLMSILLAQLSQQLREAPFTIQITIDTDTHRIHSLDVALNAVLDFSFVTDLLGGLSSANLVEPMRLDVAYSATVADYDVSLMVEAPEEWTSANFNLDFDFFNLAGNPTSNTVEIENPTIQTAEFEIAYGEILEGALSEDNAHDYYRFTAKSGDIVTISSASIPQDNLLDPYLKLFSAEGELLAENDDALNNREIGLLDAEIYLFSIPADGEYVIEVTWLFAVPERAYTLELSVLDE